jgi:hypothetical protein
MKRIIAAISSVSLAILVCFGAMLLWAGLVQVGTKAATVIVGPAGEQVNYSIAHDEDSVPLIRIDKSEYGSATVETFTDLNGRHRDKPVRGSGAFIETTAPGNRSYPSRVKWIAESYSPREIWFLVHDGNADGRCWLECYTPGIPGRTTCLGTLGATEEPPDFEHCFDVDLSSWKFRKSVGGLDNGTLQYGSWNFPGILFLAANDGIRLVNLEQRICTLIASLPPGFEGIYGGRRARSDALTSERGRRFDRVDWHVIVRTVDSLIRMNLDGSDVVRMELPQDIRSHKITYCETYDGSPYLHASLNVPVFDKTSVRGAIFDVNSSGELSNRRDYAWLNSRNALPETADSLCRGMEMPSPMLTGGAAVFSAATGAPWSATQNTLRFLPAIVSGLIAVWFSRRFQSKQPHSHQVLWLVFVACLGVFGYIGYRYHRRWPPAEFRTLTVDSFVAPAANGLEVFA